MTHMTKFILAAGALALTLAAPAAYAQAGDTPPAPPIATTPAPVTVAPAPAPPDTTMPASAPSDTTTDTTTTDTTTTDADAPKKKNHRFRIGPEVGVYLPTSSKTRDEFGSAWLSLGLGIGDISTVTTKGTTAFDLQILYQKKGDNHAFIAPIGVAYRQAFSQNGANAAYYGVTGDLVLADLRATDYDVHSGFRAGFGASALLGVNFGDSGFLEARYLFISRIKDFDLSGLDLTAGYRF